MTNLKPLRLFACYFVVSLSLSACATKVDTKRHDTSLQTIFEKGLGYASQGQWELARDSFALYSRATQIENDDEAVANGFTNRGVSLRSLGQNHFAHYLMHQLFNLQPSLEALNENHATGLIDIGEFDKAEKELSKIIDAGAADSDTYHARGIVRLHNKQYQKALADFSKEKDLNPQVNLGCYDRTKAIFDTGQYAFEISDDDRKEINSVFEAHKEALRVMDGVAALNTLNKVWLDSYFSNIKRKALLATRHEMDGLEVFDAMMVYYVRNHYDAQSLKDMLPLELFVTVIEQGWIKSSLKKVVDGKVVFDAKIASYQPIIRYHSCDGLYSVYATFEGALTGWKQNFTKEKNAWLVSSSHLIDVFRMVSAEYSQDVYDGGSALWVAYGVVKQKLSDQQIELRADVVDPLLTDGI